MKMWEVLQAMCLNSLNTGLITPGNSGTLSAFSRILETVVSAKVAILGFQLQKVRDMKSSTSSVIGKLLNTG